MVILLFIDSIRYVQETVLRNIHVLVPLTCRFRQECIFGIFSQFYRHYPQINPSQRRRSPIHEKFHRITGHIQLMVEDDIVPIRSAYGLTNNLFGKGVHRVIGIHVRQGVIYRCRLHTVNAVSQRFLVNTIPAYGEIFRCDIVKIRQVRNLVKYTAVLPFQYPAHGTNVGGILFP